MFTCQGDVTLCEEMREAWAISDINIELSEKYPSQVFKSGVVSGLHVVFALAFYPQYVRWAAGTESGSLHQEWQDKLSIVHEASIELWKMFDSEYVGLFSITKACFDSNSKLMFFYDEELAMKFRDIYCNKK